MGRMEHAVVIGGSIAGLWAARVLHDHFPHVTIIERDPLPEGVQTRPGVPQARHVHVLLAHGQRLLEQYFPGVDDRLAAAGAPTVAWTTSECAIYGEYGQSMHQPSALRTRTCSRALLEVEVRRHLGTLPGIRFLDRRQVTALVPDATGRGVAGVRVESRTGAPAETIEAGLIVDASGRGSKAPAWLEALGYPIVAERRINAFLGYASRRYQPSADWHAEWKCLLHLGYPPDMPRGGVIYPIEAGQWAVTLAGTAGHYPPTDEEGFAAFLRQMATPMFHEALADAEPLSPIYGYRRTGNRRRHYERLSRWPERFVVLGDAVCAFNPVYGQGMTVSAAGAVALGSLLRQAGGPRDGVARRFQRRLARITEGPWLLATNEDMRWPSTEGGRPSRATRLTYRYLGRLLRVATFDASVSLTLWKVTHLVAPSAALFDPRIVLRVLTGTRRRSAGV